MGSNSAAPLNHAACQHKTWPEISKEHFLPSCSGRSVLRSIRKLLLFIWQSLQGACPIHTGQLTFLVETDDLATVFVHSLLKNYLLKVFELVSKYLYSSSHSPFIFATLNSSCFVNHLS